MAIRIHKDEGNFGPGFLDCKVSAADEDGGLTVWAIFDRKEVESFLTLGDVAWELTGWSAFHGGPGRSYGDEPRVKKYRHKVLISQFRGLDI